MNDKRQPTCEERIEEHMQSRLANLLPDFDAMDGAEAVEAAREIIEEYSREGELDEDDWHEGGRCIDLAREIRQDHAGDNVLSIDKELVYNVLLSTGGPEDGFRLFWSESRGWFRGEYYFKDWFDGATRAIDGDQAESLAEFWGIYPEYEG